MKRQFEALRASLREFVEQPDYPTLVLDATDTAIVFPLKILAGFDRQDEDNYYLSFPGPCTLASTYLDVVLASLRAQIEIFGAELRARGMTPWPELPLEVNDARHSPDRRLEAIIRFMGQRLPGAGTIVWAFLPGQLTDLEGYRSLIRPLLIPRGVPPWMDRHRFLVRDQQATPAIVPRLFQEKNDRVLVFDVELDHERASSSLVESAADPAQPADDRMLAFYQLAAVDFALQRYPDALEKYGAMFNYYKGTGNTTMQALCLTGAGDALREAGKSDEALVRYRQSLAISAEEKSVPVMHAGVFGAGCTCLTLGENDEAERYLDQASRLASKLNNPYAKCEAMEKLGIARLRQGKAQQAADVWLKGKELARQFGNEERSRLILEHLIASCEQTGLESRRSEFEREHASLSDGMPHPPPAEGAAGR
jgi:MalT-like TPR region